MTRNKTNLTPCSLDQDCWKKDGHEGPHSYAEHDARRQEREAEGDALLARIRVALTDEDEIAHGEAVGANGGTGECAYCGDAWPCHTQRAIDLLLARLPAEGGITVRGHVAYPDGVLSDQACWCGERHDDEPSDGTIRARELEDIARLKDQVVVAARELVVSMILQPAGLFGRHRERFEDLRLALVAMGPDAAIARAFERAEARKHAPRCVCGHAHSSHRNDPVDPYISERCIYCRCAAFDNRDGARMQGDDK